MSLVVAPAGYGKSSAVAAWLRSEGQRAAWLSLSEADNAPERFVTALATAAKVAYGVPGSVDALVGAVDSPAGAESALLRLAAALADRGEPSLLVIDDVHLLERGGALPLVETLARLAEPGLGLVLLGRHDPAIATAKLRLAGDLAELRADVLRFDEGEARTVLTALLGADLGPERTAGIVAAVDGWPAAVQGLGLAAAAAPDPLAAVERFTASGRYVFDFLDEEVLGRLDADTLGFLVRTSVVDRFDLDLARAIAEPDIATPAGAIIDELLRRQLFLEVEARGPSREFREHGARAVVPRPGAEAEAGTADRPWYRYHRLFRELLRRHLDREPSSVATEAHRRAAAWFLESGWTAEGVRHALAAGDPAFATAVVADAVAPLLVARDFGTLGAALDAIGADAVVSRAELALARAWIGLQTQSVDAAKAWHATARAVLPERGLAVGLWHAVEARIAAWEGRLDDAIAAAGRAESNLGPDSALRLEVDMAVAVAYHMAGRLGEAMARFDAIAARAEAIDQLSTAHSARILLAEGLVTRGELGRALGIAEAVAASHGPSSPRAMVTIGHVLLERYELEAAEAWARRALAASATGRPVEALTSRLLLAAILAAADRWEEAERAIAEATRIAEGHGVAAIADGMRRTSMAYALRRGEIEDGAFEIAARLGDDGLLGELALEAGRAEDARSAFRAMEERASAAGTPAVRIHALVGHAVALRALGREESAVERMAEALELASPELAIAAFFRLPGAVAIVAEVVRRHGASPAAARILTRASGGGPRPGDVADPGIAVELSERELDVIRLVAEGMSNQEIAGALVIATGTVKRHLTNIYGKLDASNRTQAVHRAREAGLLAESR